MELRQAIQAFRNAEAAGDVEAASRLARFIDQNLNQQPQAEAPAPEEGIFASGIGGFKRAGAGLETALGSIIDPEGAAQRGLQRQQELSGQYAPGASLEKVKQAYEQRGLLSAAGEAISQVPSALAEQLPNIAATLAGGKAGAMAGTAIAPGVGTVVGGLTGAALPSLVQLYSSNLVRQAETTPQDISRLSALGAAAPATALEVASTFIPLGRTFIGKILGPEAEKMLARGTSASIEKAAKESVAGSIVRGGGVGVLSEVPTEVAQQMLERLQAGLPLTTDDALAEYAEAAYGAFLVGTPFGIAGRTAGRSGARSEYAALKQKEDIAAFEAERDAAVAKQRAEISQTKANLGIPEAPLLALPAPEKVAEPEEIDLQNPVGNITRNELAPEVLKYVDKYRKDMGMPKLQSFSIEDIRDAMTQVNPEGEQAALDSILAFKTGYKGDESFTPEDVVNAAVAKNIASDTKGFTDFLERSTGSRDLQAMSQPQLYAAFKSLSDLPQVAPGQQTVLPEGTNASRFTRKQYDSAVGQVRNSFEGANNQALSREVISEQVMQAAKLESQRAADMLIDTAIKNGDLTESRQQVFTTVNRKTGDVTATFPTREEAEAAAKGRRLDVQEQTQVAIGPKEIQKPSPRAPLPAGYDIAEQEFEAGERPAGYAITPEGKMKPLVTILEEQDVPAKVERLQGLRRAEAEKMIQDAARHEETLKKGRAALESMEARGETETDAYKKAQAKQARAEDILNRRVDRIVQRVEEYTAPLQAKPVGKKKITRKGFTVSKDGKKVGTFATRGEAEQSVLANLSDEELQGIVDAAKQGPLANRAQSELESRKKPGIKVKKSPKSQEQIERDEKVKKLEELLVPMLSKFGLKDVALKIVDSIEHGAGGKFVGIDKLIQISLEENKPVQTLRHEAIHALKELGFFTPQQWKALEREANKTWIDKYLRGQMTKLKGKVMTRLQAYQELGYSKSEIIEEAIADAFGDFDVNKAPPGMMTALLKRINEFFASLARALTGAGYESAEEIFGKIEAGKLAKAKDVETQTMEERLSLLRAAHPDEIEISTQNPQGKTRIYDPLTQMLSIDSDAIKEAMESNKELSGRIIQAISEYGFIPKNTASEDVIDVFKKNIINNLIFLHNKVPKEIRERSKLWYDGANLIAEQMADQYDMSLRQVAGIMAAMSPQKDWFQNVSMAERAIDILTNEGDSVWTPEMLQYADSYVNETDDRKEREKRQEHREKIQKIADRGVALKNMNAKDAAAFVRAFDEAFNSRQYRIVTPEGGFGDLVRNDDGTPSTMMWSTYGPIEKTVNIFRDGSRANVSEQLGFEHKIRSFYNNIAAPNSDIGHVTIDTHAVAAALFEALAGTDTEVKQNFGGTGKSDVLGVGGTYGLIADAYRDAAKQLGLKPRELQSITWEAVRGLFSEEIKASLKPKVRAEWAKYKNGEQTFNETRNNVLKIAGQEEKLNEPDWVGSGEGQSVDEGGTSYDKDFVPEGGVRLRQARELKERAIINLSAAAERAALPGIKELYNRARNGDVNAYKLLQDVAGNSLKYLLNDTNARIKIKAVKGVYMSNREPAIVAIVTFKESESQDVLARLERFAQNYEQEQVHVRVRTNKKPGHDFGDGSYATPAYTIKLQKDLTDAEINDLIEKTGLPAFTVEDDTITTYWVRPDATAEEQQQDFTGFLARVKQLNGLVGEGGARLQHRNERLYVYGDGGYGIPIPYSRIQSDIPTKEAPDLNTPRMIAEYLFRNPVKAFKQKSLTQGQQKEQALMAQVFDDLPVNDLKKPLVRKAYEALARALEDQFAVLPIKVELQTRVYREGERIPKGFKVGDLVPPYGNNSSAMRRDISENNHLLVYPTSPETFGPPGSDFSGHPLLKTTRFVDKNGTPLLYNDLLRAVHDYYAHGMAEAQFGPAGEFTAWANHMAATADPMARWALTAETRAQNAWQNFRAGAQELELSDRPYATQKAALPPVNFLLTGDKNVDAPVVEMIKGLSEKQVLGSLKERSETTSSVRKTLDKASAKFSLRTYFPTAKEAEDAAYAKAPPETREFKLFQGASTLVEEGRAVPMFHASPDIFTQFRENKPIFVSPDAKEARDYGARKLGFGDYQELADVNVYPLWVRAETPFDYENPDHVRQVMDKMSQDGTLKGKQPAFFDRGHWENIEDREVQAAIKALGFDSFYVKENNTKNLGVYNANQVKSITGNIGEFGENKDIRFSLARYTPERIDKIVNEFGYTDGRTKAYVASINPSDFVYATTSSKKSAREIYDEAGALDVEELAGESQTPFLYVDTTGKDWKIIGHEGRHRMAALDGAGVVDAPVVLIMYKDGGRAPSMYKPKAKADLNGQDFGDDIGQGTWSVVKDLTPVSYQYKAELNQKFGGAAPVKFSLPRIDPRIDARVDTITTAREQKGFAQRIVEAISPSTFSSLRQSFLNRYEQLGRYDKLLAEQMGGAALLADQSAESAALMSDLASGVSASAMGYGDRHGGIPVYRNGATVIDRNVKGLIASLAPLAKYGDPKVYQYYQFWAGAKRAERLKAEGREKVYTQDDFAYARLLQTQFPEFVDVQKDLIAFNDGIVKFMVDTEVLSPEMGQKYTENADYIPFYRQMDGEKTAGPNIFSAISGVRPPKKLKGGDAPLADFLETLVRNTQSSIQAGMKNAAANRAIKVVKAVGNVPGVALERLNTQETGPNIINVLERGKLVSYKTPDKLLVEAVGSLNMSELPFMGLISGPSNLLRNLVTKDPGFMLANLLRDSLSTYVTSGQNMMPIAGTMGNFAKALAKRSPGYEALLDAGVIGGYELSQNVEKSGEDLARDLDKKAGKKDPILMRPFTSLWSALETGTTASDAATRALVYERVLAETGNEAEALYRAVEVMNFNRKGNSPLIRILTAAVPFFNARLQGLDLFYRASTGNMNTNDAKAIQLKFWTRGATMMALSVMYYMMMADDEEYKKQEQETKDGNWLIPSLGIRIPIPFEVGVLFKVMPERITAYALGNDTGKDLRESAVRNLVSTFAFNPIPQTVKPLVEAATNFNFFTMRPIVGQGMSDVAPEFQVGPGTSKVAEKIGGQLGISPMKVDQVLKGYTGTMGIYMVDTIDLVMEQFGDSAKANKRFEQLPIIKRFVVDPEARGTVTAYYELKNSVDTFTRTSNLLEKTSKPEEFLAYVKKNAGVFAVKDYVLDLEKEMKELREMRRTITSSSMDGEQKKNLLTTVGRAEQNLTSNIQTVKKLISDLK